MTKGTTEADVLSSPLLDAFVVSALILWCAFLFELSLDPSLRSTMSKSISMVPAALAMLWVAWRKAPQHRPAISLAFSALCLLAALTSGAFQGIPLLWVAIIQLIFAWSRRWAVSYVVLTASTVFGIHLTIGNGIAQALQESLGAALMMVGGLICAILLKELVTLNEARNLAYTKLQRQMFQSQNLTLKQERTRISNTLHDGLGHKLTAVCMSLDYITKTIPSRPEKAQAEAEVARKLTSEAIDDMRKVVRAMNPIAIDNNPITTIRTLAESFSTTSSQVNFETNIDHLPEDQALLALRFSQEALTNVVRHSDATEVRMSLISCERTTFTVHDNGTPPTATLPGFGIRSLTERALEQEATVSYDTSNGFSLTLTMPTKEAVS